MTTAAEFERIVALFREELKLCKLNEGEMVAVLSQDDNLRDYRLGFLEAAKSLGARTSDVNLKTTGLLRPEERLLNLGSNPLANDREALERLKQADLVIDLILMLFSKEQIEIEKAGARILLVVEPLEILERLFPTPDLRRRVETSTQMLAEAKSLRFANAAGTDITYELGAHNILAEYGYTDKPGRWDHWPGGFLATYATGSVNGKVIMSPEDIVYPWKEFVRSPVAFKIENSKVVKIEGGDDARRLREFIESYNDDRAYAVSHIGWGLNEKCRWGVDMPGIGMDGRAHYGNVLFSLGPNTEFGGSNDTNCHLDLPMRNCDLFLDGEQIIRRGQILHSELVARA